MPILSGIACMIAVFVVFVCMPNVEIYRGMTVKTRKLEPSGKS